ncbi:hypothetical protein [Klebsiella pneumoniae]|uniref:hypothetical protein n=1 Tax=Klebsiella pneumoniae TaxID=573 RepID=UPI001ABC4353|nr:hypothetical protein [Klebsiella pneumoniae]MBO3719628.1 hypothetical protein [Klebsiella pneumoniae]HCM5829500.1 hypothetical protein [Klebsiella pneumoniae]
MNHSVVTPPETYREFRGRIIASIAVEEKRQVYGCQSMHPFRVLRQAVVAYQKHLAFYGESMLAEDATVEPHLRRALCIPAHVPLQPSTMAIIGQYLMCFLPIPMVLRRARKCLNGIGTFCGRSLVYSVQVKRTLVRRDYYCRSFDFALRELELPGTVEAFRSMRTLDIDWMRSYCCLGIRQKVLMDTAHAALPGRQISGERVLVLVQQGIIRTAEELSWLPERPSWLMNLESPSLEERSRFRDLVVLLRDTGVPPEQIARLVNVDMSRLKFERLTANLKQLNCDSEALGVLFGCMADRVLFTKPQRWSFLLQVLKIRHAADLVRFEDLLLSDQTCSVPFAEDLLASGADVDGLVACQALIQATGERDDPAVVTARLTELLSAPWFFTFGQVACAKDYLLLDQDLSAYLQVLQTYGFSTALAALAFEGCYRRLGAQALSQWLAIAALPGAGQTPTAVAQWLQKAASGGYVDAFEYLQRSGELQTFAHLRQATRVACLGRPLLAYLREVRGLVGLSVLQQWFYRDAPGIKEVHLGAGVNAINRVLLDDAFTRRDFTLMAGNQACVESLLSRYVEQKVGRYPYKADDAQKANYLQRSRDLRHELTERFAPCVKRVLTLTDGVLLDSLMPHLEAPLAELEARVDGLRSQLNELLVGRGPSAVALSPQEAELVALVYRTSASTVHQLWPYLQAREADVPSVLRGAQYPMTWRCTELQVEGDVDPRGLDALAKALDFAARFSACIGRDAHEACRHLSPKRLGDAAADVWSLAPHLGVLLAVTGAYANVAVWLREGDERLRTLAQAGSEVVLLLDSLRALFDVDIGDALDVHGEPFIAGLSGDAVAVLGSRLDACWHTDQGTPEQRLSAAIARTRARVLQKFGRWCELQRGRMVHEGESETGSLMIARVSKSPAAFFAKTAAGICTGSNTRMWEESRHVHMLVFAPGGKRIAGMALLYFERIACLEEEGTALVIRAINPMGDVLAAHSVSSMVDGYFDAAIRIAQDAGCVAVAFPSPTGMHLMSNRKDIEDDIKARYIGRSHRLSHYDSEDAAGDWRNKPRRVDGHFDAYEEGANPVSELYLIWRAQVPAQEELEPETIVAAQA